MSISGAAIGICSSTNANRNRCASVCFYSDIFGVDILKRCGNIEFEFFGGGIFRRMFISWLNFEQQEFDFITECSLKVIEIS